MIEGLAFRLGGQPHATPPAAMHEAPHLRQCHGQRQRQHDPHLDVELEQGVHAPPFAPLQVILEVDERHAQQHQQRQRVDVEGVEREDAVGRAGPAQQAHEGEHHRQREEQDHPGQDGSDHRKISRRGAS